MAYAHWAELGGGVENLEATRRGAAMDSQNIYLDIISQLTPISSVCDLGCASGHWLSAALRRGIDDIGGYDITIMPDEERHFPADKFHEINLGEPLEAAPRRFDLAISTEVAEHLPRHLAFNFMSNLTKFSDILLFGAAIPYQGGVGHHNENWAEYWALMLKENGFLCYDIFRNSLWNRFDIHFYYRMNNMLFVKEGSDGFLRKKGYVPTAAPRSLVHPEMLIQAVSRAMPPKQRELGRDTAHFYDVVTAKTVADLPDQSHDYGQEDLWFENMYYKTK